MAHIKQQLLERLIRECIKEVIEYESGRKDTTIGAPAPPAGWQGTADQPPIPEEKLTELKKVIKSMIRETFSE
jgi:hypothetical protein